MATLKLEVRHARNLCDVRRFLELCDLLDVDSAARVTARDGHLAIATGLECIFLPGDGELVDDHDQEQ